MAHVPGEKCVDGRAARPVVGRPPLEFSDEQVIVLGEELLKFVKDAIKAKEPLVHLTEWYAIEKDFTYNQWDLLRSRKEFSHYYKSSLDLMVLSTQKNSELSTAYGSRFLGVYSKDLREHEREIAAEKKRVAEEDEKLNCEQIAKRLSEGKLSQI
jgi:hypothetical protein